MKRNFLAPAPNMLWVSGFIIDTFTDKIIGGVFRVRPKQIWFSMFSSWDYMVGGQFTKAGSFTNRAAAEKVDSSGTTAVWCMSHVRNLSNALVGVFQPSFLRGRLSTIHAFAFSSCRRFWLRSVPFGKYWRKRPLVFLLLPLCQGL